VYSRTNRGEKSMDMAARRHGVAYRSHVMSLSPTFTRDEIRAAGAAAAIEPDALERLVAALPAGSPFPLSAIRFDVTHVLWYGGALIVIGAMSLFASLAFAQLGGAVLTLTALVYATLFILAGDVLWRRGLTVPGGLLISVAVAMAPLAVYGIQDAFGLWGPYGDPGNYRDFYVWVRGSWLPMEIATITAGALALWARRFPFILAIVAVALWFLSMDLTTWVYGTDDFTWDQRKIVSMWFGLGVIIIAWAVDLLRLKGDYAFWLHLVGLLAFWGGLSLQDSDSEIAKAFYGLLNVGLIAASVFLMRRAYAVFGAFGLSFYLSHLAYETFKDSILFPFALSAIGVLVIAAGLWLHRVRPVMAAWMSRTLPEGVRRLRPVHARSV
jgi:hypothetical protein